MEEADVVVVLEGGREGRRFSGQRSRLVRQRLGLKRKEKQKSVEIFGAEKDR